MIRYFFIWRWIFALIVFCISFSAIADSTFKLDLSAGPLLGCLERVSQVAQVRIVDTSGRAATATCIVTRGEFTLEQTLNRLLKPIALDWHRRKDGTVEIVAAKRMALDLAALTVDGAPVNEPERPTGPAPTVLAEHATALTRIDKQWLDTAPLLGFNQIGRYAPNVYGTGRSLSIRGIERDEDYFTSLTVSLDGIDLGTRLLDDELVPLDDVDHLDLARGPRAFEAGGGSEAGAIRLVTSAPTAEPTLRTTLGVGNEGAWRSGLKASGPIGSSGLGATVALERRVLPNFIDQRVVPEANQQRRNDSARLKLSFAPEAMPELTAQLAALSVSGESSDRWLDPYPGMQNFDPFSRNSYAAHVLMAHTRAYGAAGFVRYESPTGWSVRLHASDTDLERDGIELPERTKQTFDLENRQQLGAMIQKTLTPDWTVALGMEQEMLNSLPYKLIAENIPSPIPLPSDSPLPLTSIPLTYLIQVSGFSSKSRSALAWTEYSWNDSLKLGFGARWLKEVATTTAHQGICDKDALKPCKNSFTDIRIGVATHQLPLPLVVIEWSPWVKQKLSLSYGNGYRSGGSKSETDHYAPEYEKSTELSWHGQWLDHKLLTTATAFTGGIRDRFTFPSEANPGFNGGYIRTRGIELELEFLVSKYWRLRAGAGKVDARYRKYAYGVTDLTGQVIPGAPPRTVILGARYGDERGWYGALDAYHAAAVETGPINSSILRRPAYSLVDMRLGYRAARWDTALIVSNALDEKYLDRTEINFPGPVHYRLGDPRRIEWRTSWDW